MHRDKLLSGFINFLFNYGILFISLIILYVPTLMLMGNTIWQSEEQSHGPIILALVIWLFWNKKEKYNKLSKDTCSGGWGFVLIGLTSYFLGKVLEIWLFEVGSLIPIMIGVVLLDKSIKGLKLLWFPILFIVFLIPLPGFVVDAITGGLKGNISKISEYILYFLGYPIARTGVTLTIGQYQLLVADACSGLNSMFSLFALGLFYLQMQAYKSKLFNMIFISAIVPIAFMANVIRVIILVLITYYFGDAAGQGFIHSAAGILLFIMALLFLYALDAVLIKLQKLD